MILLLICQAVWVCASAFAELKESHTVIGCGVYLAMILGIVFPCLLPIFPARL